MSDIFGETSTVDKSEEYEFNFTTIIFLNYTVHDVSDLQYDQEAGPSYPQWLGPPEAESTVHVHSVYMYTVYTCSYPYLYLEEVLPPLA